MPGPPPYPASHVYEEDWGIMATPQREARRG
jgi:hypothetical protein